MFPLPGMLEAYWSKDFKTIDYKIPGMLAVCWPPKDGREESQLQRRNSLLMLSPEENISSCLVFALDNLFVCLWLLLFGDLLFLTMASCLIWLKEGYWGFILYFASLACCSSFLKEDKCKQKNTFMETVIFPRSTNGPPAAVRSIGTNPRTHRWPRWQWGCAPRSRPSSPGGTPCQGQRLGTPEQWWLLVGEDFLTGLGNLSFTF